MFKNKNIERLTTVLLILLIILVMSKIGYIFKPIYDVVGIFIGPIIIGGFIYYWLRPVTRKLSQGKLYKYKGVISALTIIVFFSILLIIISSAGVTLTAQLEDTIRNYSGKNYIRMIEDNLGNLNINLEYFEKYKDQAKDWVKGFADNIPGMFSSIGDFGTQLALLPFVLYYLLKEEDKIQVGLYRNIPKTYQADGVRLLNHLDQVLSTYIVGQLLVALIIGGLMFIGYLIIGMPNAFLMASFSVITAVIPLIGTFLGILPPLLIALTLGLDMVIKVIILSIIVQQLEGNIITPNLMGSRLDIHPFIIMVVVIISIDLLGLFGAFIGIPLYLVISITIKEYIRFKREKKNKEVYLK